MDFGFWIASDMDGALLLTNSLYLPSRATLPQTDGNPPFSSILARLPSDDDRNCLLTREIRAVVQYPKQILRHSLLLPYHHHHPSSLVSALVSLEQVQSINNNLPKRKVGQTAAFHRILPDSVALTGLYD